MTLPYGCPPPRQRAEGMGARRRTTDPLSAPVRAHLRRQRDYGHRRVRARTGPQRVSTGRGLWRWGRHIRGSGTGPTTMFRARVVSSDGPYFGRSRSAENGGGAESRSIASSPEGDEFRTDCYFLPMRQNRPGRDGCCAGSRVVRIRCNGTVKYKHLTNQESDQTKKKTRYCRG